MKAVSLEDMISGPVRAVIMGQVQAANAAMDYIRTIGFEDDSKGKFTRARTFEFSYVHPVSDPENPGSVINTPVKMTVPALSMFPIPAIKIDEATINFEAEIMDVDDSEKESSRGTKIPPKVIGRFTRKSSSSDESSLKSTLSISIKMKQMDMPEGLAKMFDRLHESVTVEAIGK